MRWQNWHKPLFFSTCFIVSLSCVLVDKVKIFIMVKLYYKVSFLPFVSEQLRGIKYNNIVVMKRYFTVREIRRYKMHIENRNGARPKYACVGNMWLDKIFKICLFLMTRVIRKIKWHSIHIIYDYILILHMCMWLHTVTYILNIHKFNRHASGYYQAVQWVPTKCLFLILDMIWDMI